MTTTATGSLRIPVASLTQTGIPTIVDPIHDGAADPTLVWNAQRGEWWCLFVQRRSNTRTLRPEWNGRCHGTAVAVASAGDGGRRWIFRGSLDLDPGWTHDTYWGPDVVADDDGILHLFVTRIDGVPEDEAWDTFGRPSPWHRRIRRYESPDGETWSAQGAIDLGTDWAVDPTVHRLPDGRWAMWFKAEADGGAIWRSESDDLRSWSAPVEAIAGWHEGPDVFELGGRLWLIAETRDPGFAVYRSDDGREWTGCAPISVSVTGDGPERPGRAPNVLTTGSDTAVLACYIQAATDSFGADVPTSGRASTCHLVRLTSDGDELSLGMFTPDDPLPTPGDRMSPTIE